MQFEITHKTHYKYPIAASEAHLELRLTPLATPTQQVIQHSLTISPEAEMSSYTDCFGNHTHFYSIATKHTEILITNRLRVQTHSPLYLPEFLNASIENIRSTFQARLPHVFHYLQSIDSIPTGEQAASWVDQYLDSNTTLQSGLDALCKAVHSNFEYVPGSTDNATPLAIVWKQRKGVCQDFAQVMLSVLRTAGIPCRYVCGYIESEPPKSTTGRQLVGSLATHAWIEVLLPNNSWVSIDPTNNCWCTEQHVAVSVGRDFRDAAPVRGTFKASEKQTMEVTVNVQQIQ